MPTRVPPVHVLLVGALLLAACGGADDPTTPAADDDLAATVAPVEEPTASEAPTVADPATETSPAAPAPSDTAADDPATACTLTEADAGIELAAPTPGADVGETFRLAGCGNTFEGAYIWEVELADGTIAGDGFGQMSCGNGCVGTFDEDVTVEGTGEATLHVFTESAQDGSRTDEVSIPITLG